MAKTLPTGSMGRRRWMTVMFADLVDFSGLARQLDAEALLEVLDDVLGAIVPPIEAAGGHVDKFLGDGLLACFGDPVGHEDDAARAVRAALAMQDAMGALASPVATGRQLALRIGLATGNVVSGPIRAGRSETWTVLGATVNLAKRLESLAPPGAILTDDATRRSARRRHAFLPLGPMNLKGFLEPVACHRVLGSRPEREGWGHRGPFVGREAHLEQFGAMLAGRVPERTVLIHGPAGIGKTALLARFHAMARRHGGHRIVRTGVAAHRAEEPGAYLARLWPMLAPGLPCPVPVEGDPRGRLVASAPSEGVVWLLDDAQWMDAWSRRVLASFLALRGDRDFVVLAGRDVTGLLPWPGPVRILEGLRDAEAMDLLLAWAGGDSDRIAPDESGRFRVMVRRASGNPLHLRELWRAGPGEAPLGLHGLLQARLDLLSADERSVARLASVLGPRWPRVLWEQLLDAREATVAGQLHDRGILTGLGADEVGFADALLQETLYGQMLEPERRAWHTRVALCPAMALLPAAWRARQWAAAGEADEARAAWRDAAAEALRAGGPREALAHLERAGPLGDARSWALWLRAHLAAGEAPAAAAALASLEAIPESGPPDTDLLLATLRVLDAVGAYARAIAWLDRWQPRFAPGEQADRVEIERAWLAMRMGQWREARHRTRAVLRRVARTPSGDGRDALLARIRHDLAVHERLVGHVGTARRHAIKALALRQATGDRLGEADAWHNLGTILHARGDLRAAARALAHCRRLYQDEAATRRWLAMELNMGVVRLELGEWSVIRDHVPDWERRALEAGDPLTAACLALLQVQAALAGATVRAADAPLARARHLLAMLPGGAPWGDLHRLGGLARGLDGNLEEAGPWLEEALSTALAAGDRRQEALARRALARWAWHRGDAGRAAREAALAVAWHGRVGAFLEQARSLRLLQELGGETVRLSAGDGTMQMDPLDRLRRAGAVAEAERLATREGVLAWQP